MSPILYSLFSIDAIFLNAIELKVLGANVYIYIIIFFLFFLIGNLLAKSKFVLGCKLNFNHTLPDVIDKRKIYLSYPIIIAVLIVFFINNFTSDLASFNEGRSMGNKGQGPILYFVSILVPNILGFYMLSKNKLDKVLVFVFLLVSTSSMLVGFRGPFLSNVLFLFLIRYKILNKWFFKKDFVYLGIFICLIAVYGGMRNSNFEAGSIDTVSILQSTIMRISSYELIGIMDSYVAKNGFDFFQHNLRDDFWIMIPRFLLGDKPISLSEVIANNVFASYLNSIGIFLDNYGGVSYTAIGEGLYNFGVTGVILYGFGLGFVFSVSDKLIKSGSWFLFLIGKAVLMNILGLIEATQLGINAIIMNIVTSVLLLILLKR